MLRLRIISEISAISGRYLFQQFVVRGLIVGFDEFWVEDGHEVLQQHVRLDRRNLVVGLLLHVAVDNLFFLESLEEFVTGFRSFQGKSGDLAIEEQSQASLIASDLIENLKYVTI